jgi:hypothetical protein
MGCNLACEDGGGKGRYLLVAFSFDMNLYQDLGLIVHCLMVL